MTIRKALKVSLLSIAGIAVLFVCYFLAIRKLDNKEMNATLTVPEYKFSQPVLLPSLFIDGARFYIKMPLVTGDTALAYGDSGGGLCMITPAAVDKLKLKEFTKSALGRGVFLLNYIPFRKLVTDEHMPAPVTLNSMILRHPLQRLTEPFLLVPPMDEELKFMMQVMPFDIFLGQGFFMGKAWTIDYINRQIWVNTPVSAGDTGVQKLGFKKNDEQQKIFGHPSMRVAVDGEMIDVLFDTGATIVLSDNGKKMFNTMEKSIGGSFIARSIFGKWHTKHPDWKVYEKADAGRDVIEVPKVNINGYDAGPVLFAMRDDEVWSEGMIHTMDKVVKGAIGGSALKYFKVTIDYNFRTDKIPAIGILPLRAEPTGSSRTKISLMGEVLIEIQHPF